MRKILSGTLAFVFMSALAAPALAGGGCFGVPHTETAQTPTPVVAQTTVPLLPIVVPMEQPNG